MPPWQLQAVLSHILDNQTYFDYYYVATVYTQDPDGPEHAFANAAVAGAWLARRGVHVLVPITHSHPIAEKMPAGTSTHDLWMAQDFPLVKHAKGLILVEMPGHDRSKGMAMEYAWAKAWDKPIYRLPWPLPEKEV